MHRGCRILLVCIAAAVLVACGPAVKAPVGDRSQRPAWIPKTHKVRPGDTLYSIAWEYGLDYGTIARWNGIRAPYTIVVGQRLYLYPRNASHSTTVAKDSRTSKSASSNSIKKPSSTTAAGSAPAARTSEKTVKNIENSSAKLAWQWPTQGRLIRTFQANSPGKKGIDIAGNAGQPVRAAAPGRVVYSGSGLVGYGRLIIIKHNQNYLSAYGHNQKLFAQEGNQVHAGQVIAEMGNSGTNRVQLHFEIRRDGKPVDPLKYLPGK